MEIKILQVFYGKDGLPYKDKDRQVHFPITGTGFLGASNTTKIKFYYDELDNLDETTWVAVSKLPNGKVGSRVLESHLDSELNEHYALLELDNYYTQYKGDVFISLQGYQGGVDFDYDEENSQYEIHGTPTIAATGSIKFTINYANQFVGSGETDNINFQRILAALGTKLGMRAYSEHVEELPSEGSQDVFYVVNDDPNNPNLANIYVWNQNTRHYIWVGDNTLDLGEYYTKEQGNQFEENTNEELENYGHRIENVESELSNVASGSPKGVYDTLSDLESAYPTGTTGIYVVSANGHWYYWNGNAWTDGGTYLSSAPDSNLINTSNNAVKNSSISKPLADLINYLGIKKQYNAYLSGSGNISVLNDAVFYPITTKDNFLVIEEINILVSTSNATNVVLQIKQGSEIIATSKNTLATSSGRHDDFFSFTFDKTILKPNTEYSLNLSAEDSYLGFVVGNQTTENDQFVNTGTEYYYGNTGIKFKGSINYIFLDGEDGENINDLFFEIEKPLTQDNKYDAQVGAGNVAVTGSSVFYPITTKNAPIIIKKVSILVPSSSNGVVSLSIKSGEKTIATSTNSIETPSSSQTSSYFDFYFNDIQLLTNSEYKLELNANASCLGYISSVNSKTDDGYISNEGTDYYYGYSTNAFRGSIEYKYFDSNHNIWERFRKIDPTSKIEPITIFEKEDLDHSKEGITYSESGNAFTFSIDENTSALTTIEKTFDKKSLIYITGNCSSFSGDVNVYLRQGQASVIYKGKLISETGKFAFVIDAAYEEIYDHLTSFSIWIGGPNCGATISDFKVVQYDIVNQFNYSSCELFEILGALKSSGEQLEDVVLTPISSPNGTKFIPTIANNGTVTYQKVFADKVLFAGNSLLVAWINGMAASNGDKTYYYLLSQLILSKNDSATFSKLGINNFETAINSSVSAAKTWVDNNVSSSNVPNDLGLCLIQIGDNVSSISRLRECLSYLIQKIKSLAPTCRIVCAGSWYYSLNELKEIKSACLDTGVEFINFSNISSKDNQNSIGNVAHASNTAYEQEYTINSYTDDDVNKILTLSITINGDTYNDVELPYSSYSVSGSTLTVVSEYVIITTTGVASHPNDIGFLLIANRIAYKLGMIGEEGDIQYD